MIIVIEGIDGAGKTTLAELLRARLSAVVSTGPSVRKDQVARTDHYARQQLTALRDLIWHRDEPPRDPFGARFWIYLIAAWYSALEPKGAKLLEAPRQVRLYDGWFYRNVIKTVLRGALDKNWVMGLFSGVEEPRLVLLLDIDPAMAWRRDCHKKPTEIGRWDGYLGEAEESFCRYQSAVRAELLAFAAEHGWAVLGQRGDERPNDLVDRALEICLSALDREALRTV
jgi:dTMP kinase